MNQLRKKYENEIRELYWVLWSMHRVWFWVGVFIIIIQLFKVNKTNDDIGLMIFWGVVIIVNFIAIGKYPAKTGKEQDLFDDKKQ